LLLHLVFIKNVATSKKLFSISVFVPKVFCFEHCSVIKGIDGVYFPISFIYVSEYIQGLPQRFKVYTLRLEKSQPIDETVLVQPVISVFDLPLLKLAMQGRIVLTNSYNLSLRLRREIPTSLIGTVYISSQMASIFYLGKQNPSNIVDEILGLLESPQIDSNKTLSEFSTCFRLYTQLYTSFNQHYECPGYLKEDQIYCF